MPNIRISHYHFAITKRYFGGQPLGIEEADVLNRVRAERIRDNIAKAMVAEGALEAKVLSPEELAEWRRRVVEYDAAYTLAAGKKYSIRSPIELAIERVATELAIVAANAQNRQLSDAELVEAVAALSSQQDVIAEGHKRVADAQRVARQTLEDL